MVLTLALMGAVVSLSACGSSTDSNTDSNSETNSSKVATDSSDSQLDEILSTTKDIFGKVNAVVSYNAAKQEIDVNLDKTAKTEDMTSITTQNHITSAAVLAYQTVDKTVGEMYPIVGYLNGEEVFKVEDGKVTETNFPK